MAVKIRLMRIGTKKRPFYRVVAVDEKKKRTGGYLELLGTYNPLTQPKEVILKQERIDFWKERGAILSHGFLRVLGQAPQKPPRKPKKEKTQKEKAPEQTGEKVEESTEGAIEEQVVEKNSPESEEVTVTEPAAETVKETDSEEVVAEDKQEDTKE